MSWLRIDDKFEDNAKVEPLSDAAHRLWMRAACWCKKPENLHTNGFVPKALLEVIAKRSAPRAKLIKLAEELVNANAGGTKEHGLWEPVEGGWLFHDWDKYKAPSEDRGGPDDGTPRAKSEAGKLGGKRSAEVRRAKFGSAQPKQPEAEPTKQPEADASEARPEATPEAAPKQPEAPDPVPDPDQPDTSSQRPESTEQFDSPGAGAGKTLQQRASEVLLNPFAGEYSQPATWPETQAVAVAWTQPFGIRAPKLRNTPTSDPDLRAILQAFADGYSVGELVLAGDLAKQSDVFRRAPSPGPALFTAAVLRRLLASGASVDSDVIQVDA